jgi:urea transport system substrate-binding protein
MALAVTAQQYVDAPPAAVFALFGAGTRAGWLFDAVCDRLAVGAAVTLRAPMLGHGTAPVEILGRVAALRPPSRIEIVHDQPWRGRLRVLVEPAGRGSRLRLIADLDDAGLRWLMRRHGHPVAEDSVPGTHPVGLLTSKSGPASVFAAATEHVAALAVEEINADGGIRGEPVRLVVGDDGTDPQLGATEAWRLVRAGCRAIMATTTSATFTGAAHALRDAGVLLVQTVMNEGGLGGDLRVQLGERPQDQVRAAAAPVMRAADGRRWFLAGNDYVWPRHMHAAARRVLAEERGAIVGEDFAPLGTRDFTPLIERILQSGADVVLSSFVGADLVQFERQCHAMGLRERCRTLAPALDEPTRERIGAAAAAGVFGVAGYFEQLPGTVNDAFVRRYRATYGAFAPPVSSISESVYEGLLLYAAAARRAGADDPAATGRELRHGRSARLPRGTVAMTGPETVQQRLFVAEATADGFDLHPPATGH